MQFLMSVFLPFLGFGNLNTIKPEVCLEPETMHAMKHPIYRQAERGILQQFCGLIQDAWAGLMETIKPGSRRKPGAVGTKRWSSTQLAKAPGRLKPMSHLQFARQQKTCANEGKKELQRTDLEGMVRDGICMDGTYLAFADLSYAFLSNGRFRGSNLSGANLARAIIIGGNFMDANLRNACLVSADLRHCNFHYADLSGANLRGANLASADLTGANLWGADLYGANLEGALLAGSNWNPPNI